VTEIVTALHVPFGNAFEPTTTRSASTIPRHGAFLALDPSRCRHP
jgi:hypothetical protein